MRACAWLVCAAMFAAATLGGVTGPAALAAEQVKGTVFKPDGKPAPGAKVYLYYLHDITGYGSRKLSETLADAEGRFALEMPKVELPAIAIGTPVMRCILLARLEGCAVGIMPISPWVLDGYEVCLDKGRDTDYVVKAMAGKKPVEGALVCPVIQAQPLGALMRVEETAAMTPLLMRFCETKTNADGVAALKGIPTGEVTLAVEHDKFSMMGPAARAADPNVLNLKPVSFVIQGKVMRQDTEEPIEGALVLMPPHMAVAQTLSAVTDKQGVFRLSFPMWCGSSVGLWVVDPSTSPSYATTMVTVSTGFGSAAEMAGKYQPSPDKQGGCMLWESKCQIGAGKVLQGRVTNSATGEPASGAVVQLRPPLREDNLPVPFGARFLPFYCITDALGRYTFRFPGDKAAASLAAAPAGYVIASAELRKPQGDGGEILTWDLEAKFKPEGVIQLLAKTPDGHTTPLAVVIAWVVGTGARWTGKTGANGGAFLSGVPRGGEVSFYALSSDNALGVSGTFIVAEKQGVQKVDIQLKPTRATQVSFQDTDGKAVAALVRVWAVVDEDARFVMPLLAPDDGEPQEEWQVRGLVLGVKYRVTAQAKGYMPATQGGYAEFRADEKQEQPKVVVRLAKSQQAK